MSATAAPVTESSPAPDHRGSWVPTRSMITTRIMELRRRRSLMAALIAVNIGVPSLFLTIRLIAHAVAPKTYGPAGGYDTFTGLVAGLMFVFGFIVAATLGCTAGSVDLNDGMFRHLVVTGRSRLALYFARIPAGLAIIVPMVAAGFAIVCTVCVLAAPPNLSFDGVTVPSGLTQPGFERWAAQHPGEVICGLPWHGSTSFAFKCVQGAHGTPKLVTGGAVLPAATTAQLRSLATRIAHENFRAYSSIFRAPSVSLMVKSGLWIELEAVIGFIVGLGLASLMGQRTLPVILMVVLELILTPLFSRAVIPHLINLQRGIVGLAMARIEPVALSTAFSNVHSGNGAGPLRFETATVASLVIAAWLVGWTALGAWRMATRDA